MTLPEQPCCVRLPISTHTPAWGVTICTFCAITRCEISTHTPAWGVTQTVLFRRPTIPISTHTPAWGVTHMYLHLRTRCPISTHTPAWGVTRYNHRPCPSDKISTHTPAWGVTLDVVSKRHKIITRADYPMQNHTISHKIFLFYSFPLRSAPEFQIICGSQPE